MNEDKIGSFDSRPNDMSIEVKMNAKCKIEMLYLFGFLGPSYTLKTFAAVKSKLFNLVGRTRPEAGSQKEANYQRHRRARLAIIADWRSH